MEKRSWLWKRKSSERSPGESESSGSISSHSERYSDDQQEASKTSASDNAQSPEVTSKAVPNGGDANDSVRALTEKLSAALVNVSAKEDLVKQHAKVAEEAIAGWEKAENNVAALKQKLEVATQQNSVLEDKVSHLDGALKECVRQLRQARDEQEKKINEAVEKKTREFESTKSKLESQLLELQTKLSEKVDPEPIVRIDPEILHKIEFLERENSELKNGLFSRSEELEIMAIERDFSTQAAEMASKQHLESIKKVAKLEAECRRLKSLLSKNSSGNDRKLGSASSIYVDSVADSQSDGGERLSAVEMDTRRITASALINELDQFKNEKVINNRNIAANSVEIDLMDDFLEMERLAAMPDSKPEPVEKESNDVEKSLRAEIEGMVHRTAEMQEKIENVEAEKRELMNQMEKMEAERYELEEKIVEIEAEKCELENKMENMEVEKDELEEKIEKIEVEKRQLEIALTESQGRVDKSEIKLKEAEIKLEEIQKELNSSNESKQDLGSRFISMEVEAQTMCTKIESLEEDIEKERAFSAQASAKCQKLEEELFKTKQEVEIQEAVKANGDMKIKQEEELTIAAGKLAECQKTIASLGRQLNSLATLEDFLIDTKSIPEFSKASLSIPKPGGESWKLHSNETYSPKIDLGSKTAAPTENSGCLVSTNDGKTPPSSSSSTSSSNHVNSEKNRNGFAKFFSRTKNGVQLEL